MNLLLKRTKVLYEVKWPKRKGTFWMESGLGSGEVLHSSVSPPRAAPWSGSC